MKKLLFISYSLFLLIFTSFSYLFIDSNLSYLKSFYTGIFTNKRLEVTFVYIVLIAIYIIFYLIFLRLWKKGKLTKSNVKFLIGITFCILILSYPAMLSYDIFNYVLTAKVFYLYHENPYIIMPIQFSTEPYLSFTRAANKIALYGPSWISLTSIPYLLGFGNFIITLFNFKLLVGIFYLLTAWLIHKITKDLLPVIIFSLNPLVAIEILVSGHNDIVLVFFSLLFIFLAQRKKIFSSFVFLVVSIFVKYSTLFLIPLFLYISRVYKKKAVSLEKIYLWSWVLMMAAFLLSPIREEIYPWYALWFLPFAALSRNKTILYISLTFSFCLLFTYVPFMLFGTYLEPTPIIKTLITFVPVIFVLIYLFIKGKLWEKRFYPF